MKHVKRTFHLRFNSIINSIRIFIWRPFSILFEELRFVISIFESFSSATEIISPRKHLQHFPQRSHQWIKLNSHKIMVIFENIYHLICTINQVLIILFTKVRGGFSEDFFMKFYFLLKNFRMVNKNIKNCTWVQFYSDWLGSAEDILAKK